jgi:predicted secreted protein
MAKKFRWVEEDIDGTLSREQKKEKIKRISKYVQRRWKEKQLKIARELRRSM